jgi:hypothetical protein
MVKIQPLSSTIAIGTREGRQRRGIEGTAYLTESGKEGSRPSLKKWENRGKKNGRKLAIERVGY